MVAIADNRVMLLDGGCWHCGRVFTLWVNPDDLLDWTAGAGPIEKMMPYLTAGERELLISNTCSECFDSLFPPLDSDD